MALVIDKPVYTRAGVTPEPGWTWDDFDAAMKRIRDRTGRAGDSGMYGVMYLYDLYLRQHGKAFFTEDALGFTEADLTDWWTKAERGVKEGVYADAKKVVQVKPKSAVSAELAGSEFTWDNFTVRYSLRGQERVRPRAHPHHGRQEDRPVPGLADAERLQAHPAPQGGRPFVYLMVQFMRDLPRELDEACRL
ncbi:hypothetical protein SFUMM280S_03038 [Streptomyces fumanus]